MKTTKPPRLYIPRVSFFERQRVRLQRYEQSVIRRAEEAGEEPTIANVADLRWLWNLADKAPRPSHRERLAYRESYRRDHELGKALAGAWVQIALGVPKDKAMFGAYKKVSAVLGWKEPKDGKEPTAKRRMESRLVTRIARRYIAPEVPTSVDDDERAKFWAQFPDLTEADCDRICGQIKKKPGFQSG
jgi:hypothetical protein